LHQLHGAVDRNAFLVAGDRNEIEPFGLPLAAAMWSRLAATAQAIAPFMSTAPRP
jgi:hypothetical protein